jgi:phosphorylated CTD-interacting factor 1
MIFFSFSYLFSIGSFLDQRPLSGGFEANPPFLEEVMAPMAFHILGLLERAQLMNSPLCFICLWPGWDDCVAYDLLMTSRFMRKLIVFEKGDHSYKEGLQHRATSNQYRRAQARTFVFFMQTDAAQQKWPTTEEKINHFKKAFMQHR